MAELRLARATPLETAQVVAQVLAPLVARGLLRRRPLAVRALAAVDGDALAIRLLQRLRDRHRADLLVLGVPGRPVAITLTPAAAERVLAGSPETFRVASAEKRAALAHFQPEGVLGSRGADRQVRRRANEAVLEPGNPVHRLAPALVAAVREEAGLVLADGLRTGRLDWDTHVRGWWRAARRVLLGTGARDDSELTDLLRALRSSANWSFLGRPRRVLHDRFDRRLQAHLDRGEPGSLAALVAALPTDAATAPSQQVPQWLFAYDATGIATGRALALLAGHPDAQRRARDEAAGSGEPGAPAELPFLRACLLESVRLWPTTPGLLRDTTAPTTWGSAVLPEGSAVSVYLPFLHRDDRGAPGPDADRFAPHLWSATAPQPAITLTPYDPAVAGLLPFSGGPASCPGRDLVLLTASTWLATLLSGAAFQLERPSGALGPRRPLPRTLDPFRLRFRVTPPR